MTKPFSLNKHERLKSRKQIDALFLHGKAFFVFPFKIKYALLPNVENSTVKFAISVPKKGFKKAVHRNRLKRLTRESYRINKVELKNRLIEKKYELNIMFIYTHNEILKYQEVETAVIKSIGKLQKLLD